MAAEFKKESGVTLLSPSDTRFASSAIEMDRLSDFKNSISTVFHSQKADEHYRHLSREGKEKFDVVLTIVQDRDFWTKLAYLLRIILPIYHLIRIAEGGSKSCVEAVAHMYVKLHELEQFYIHDASIETHHKDRIRGFLQDRWKMLHTPLMDSAFLLNPAYKNLVPWTNPEIMKGFRDLSSIWKKFIDDGTSPDYDDRIVREIDGYVQSLEIHNEFAKKIRKPQPLYDMLASWNLPKDERPNPEPVNSASTNTVRAWWVAYGAKWPLLQQFALLVLEQPISQSAAEQSLSCYKVVMNDLRNSMGQETQDRAVFVYYNIRKVSEYKRKYNINM